VLRSKPAHHKAFSGVLCVSELSPAPRGLLLHRRGWWWNDVFNIKRFFLQVTVSRTALIARSQSQKNLFFGTSYFLRLLGFDLTSQSKMWSNTHHTCSLHAAEKIKRALGSYSPRRWIYSTSSRSSNGRLGDMPDASFLHLSRLSGSSVAISILCLFSLSPTTNSWTTNGRAAVIRVAPSSSPRDMPCKLS